MEETGARGRRELGAPEWRARMRLRTPPQHAETRKSQEDPKGGFSKGAVTD